MSLLLVLSKFCKIILKEFLWNTKNNCPIRYSNAQQFQNQDQN